MEDWPSVVGRQGQATNRHDAASVKSRCGERSWKRHGKTASDKLSGDERK